MPSSGSKTKIVETEGRKETGKHDGKGRAESARESARESAKESTKAGAAKAGATTAKHTASPKAKMSETEIRKQNGKKAESANADGKAAAKPGRQAASGRKSERSLN